MSHPARPSADGSDRILGDLIEEYTARRQAGESLDVDGFVREHPAHAEPLRALLPALAVLGQFEKALSLGRVVPPPAEELGTLGDFRILREIGRGGMGVVYEAEQISLRRRVALKVLPFAATLDPRQLQRFHNEAQAAAHLHHTHIVPVFAVGCERGVHFYAMQYIEGGTLAEMIDELRAARSGAGSGDPPTATCPVAYTPGSPDEPTGPYLPAPAVPRPAPSTQAAGSTRDSVQTPAFFRKIAELGRQAAEALDYAHQQGVVHRDIKPGNLMVDAGGHLWITDFGLARCQTDTGLTMTGDLVGTLRYMSPEQALGKPGLADHRADVYGLGVTLYELLTLEPVYRGTTREELLRQIATEEPRPPRRLNRRMPVELETVVLKAIAREPAERYASAAELADDLRRFLEDRPIRARRPTWAESAARWARRHKTVVWAAVVMLLLGLAGLATSTLLIWQEAQRTEDQRDRAERLSKQAQQERDRAEKNLDKALNAMDEIYVASAESRALRGLSIAKEDRWLLKKALTFYEDFVSQNREVARVRPRLLQAYRRVGDLQRILGAPDDAEKAYRSELELTEQRAAAAPDQVAFQHDLIDSLNRLGTLLAELSRRAEAEKVYLRSLAAAEALLKRHPRDAYLQRALGAVQQNRGELHYNDGRYAEAERLLRLAMQHTQAARKLEPRELRNVMSLCSHHQLLCEALMHQGKFATVESLDAEALAVAELLRKEAPHDRLAGLNYANIYNNRAIWLTRAKRFPEAEASLRRAIEVRQSLARAFPRVPIYRQTLAGALSNLGITQEKAGQPQAAVKSYCAALVWIQPLTAEFPDVPAYGKSVNEYSSRLEALINRLQDPQDTVPAVRHALDTVGSLWEQYPSNLRGRRQVGIWHWMLGDCLQALGRLPEAEKAFREALAVHEQLVKEQPANLTYQEARARCLKHLGVVRNRLGQPKAGAEALSLAAKLHRELVKQQPQEARHRHDLAVTLMDLALLQRAVGLAEQAEQTWLEAEKLQRTLAKEFPGDPAYRQQLGQTISRLAVLYQNIGRYQEAEAGYREALRLRGELFKAHPKVALYLHDLADSHNSLGVLYNTTNQVHKAIAAFEKGRKLRRQLVEEHDRDPKSPKYRYELANSELNLGWVYFRAGRVPDSEAAYQEAVHLQKPLAEVAGASSADRQQMVWIYQGMADMYRLSGRPAEGEAPARSGVLIGQMLVKDYPESMPFAVDFTRAVLTMGEVQRACGKLKAALPYYDRVIIQARVALRTDRLNRKARDLLFKGHVDRAQTLGELGRHKEAVPDWEAALEVGPAPLQQSLRLDLARTLARAGDHARAVTVAAEVGGPDRLAGSRLYRLVVVYALSAGAARTDAGLTEADRQARAERYLARALELLRLAAKAGYLKGAASRQALARDPELTSLRSSAEFKRLLEETEKK
jgi:serine/threonine protein kinase/tetratricopeptide (TPR) repeat protein